MVSLGPETTGRLINWAREKIYGQSEVGTAGGGLVGVAGGEVGLGGEVSGELRLPRTGKSRRKKKSPLGRTRRNRRAQTGAKSKKSQRTRRSPKARRKPVWGAGSGMHCTPVKGLSAGAGVLKPAAQGKTWDSSWVLA